MTTREFSRIPGFRGRSAVFVRGGRAAFAFALGALVLLAVVGCGELETLRDQTETQQRDLARTQSERDQFKKAYYEVVAIRERESREAEAARQLLVREKNDAQASLTLAREQYESDKQRLETQIARQQAEFEKTEKGLRDLVDSLKADLEDQRRQAAAALSETKTLQTRLAEAEGRANQAAGERDEARGEIETLRVQAAAAADRATAAESETAQRDEKLAGAAAALEDQRRQHGETRNALERQTAETERLERELVRLQTEMRQTPVPPTATPEATKPPPPPRSRHPASVPPEEAGKLAEALRAVLAEAGVPEPEFAVVVDPQGPEGPAGPVVRLSSDWLFQEQSVLLTDAASRALVRVAQALAKHPGVALRVEGHTDSQPVRTLPFPDNWGLASARADAVVRCLEGDGGLDGKRLTAVGRSRFSPLASNNTPEGRKQNRRVELWIAPAE